MKWRNDYLMDVINNSGYYAKGQDKWLHQLKCIDTNYVSAWDWQWYFSLAAQNQLCLYPKVNLVSNIGNDSNATHTSLSDITIESHTLSFPLKHPPYIVPNVSFDNIFYHQENTLRIKISRIIPYNIKKIIKNLILQIK